MARQETTVGFEVYPICIKLSVKEFAEKHEVDYATAQGVIKFLEAKGLATKVGTKRTSVTGKGKPTNIYEVPVAVLLAVA